MRIAKPLLLITTPVGVALGLYEGWRLAGPLVFLLAAALGVFGSAMAMLIMTIRREQADERARRAAPSVDAPPPSEG